MKKPFYLITAALFSVSISCFAVTDDDEEIDFGKMTCEKLFAADKDFIGTMLFWVDGYISAQSGNTVMSKKWIDKLATHMGEYCAKNPKKTVMNMIKAVPQD